MKYSLPHHKDPAHVQEKKPEPFFSKSAASPLVQAKEETPFFQTKLAIAKPGDPYEREADAVADSVVSGNTQTPVVQKRPITPIQRATLATPAEDEKLSTAEARMEKDKLLQEKPEIQRMDAQEEEEPVQKQAEKEEEEPVQMQAAEEEEPVQMQAEEEEEPLQAKHQSGETAQTASSGLTQRLQSSQGNGQPLPPKARAEMETAFGVDFQGVNVHTDAQSIQMNRELGAQAFTHGSDVYFNSGKFNPETSGGKHLLAHELTHVVQQSGQIQKMIQKYGGCTATQDATISADHSNALAMLDTAITKLGTYNGTTPTEVHTALSAHFGGSTSTAFASWIKVNIRFLRLVAPLANYKCETVGNSNWACTTGADLATTFWCVPLVDIRLCPSYFLQSATERSTTLIHEWVHKYGCNFDLGYEHEPGYSGNKTVTQLLNADSFANFVRDVQ